jgi:hypothetical protein
MKQKESSLNIVCRRQATHRAQVPHGARRLPLGELELIGADRIVSELGSI